MARNVKISSRAGRLIALALLTFAVTVPSIFADRAGAWQLAMTRSGDAGPVRISSNHVDGLYPGSKRTLLLTLRNRDPKRAIRVRQVRVRDVKTTKRGCEPSRRNLRARVFTIPPRGIKRVRALLTMPNSVATACQGAVFQLRYRAATWR